MTDIETRALATQRKAFDAVVAAVRLVSGGERA
jgi:hypothetical protein